MGKNLMTLLWKKATEKPQTTVTKLSPLLKFSGVLLIATGKGIHPGFYSEYKSDMNAHHVQAKKGDGFFQTMDNVLIDTDEITGYYPVTGFELPGKLTAEASQ